MSATAGRRVVQALVATCVIASFGFVASGSAQATGSKTRSGSFPNNVAYSITIDVSSDGYVYGSAGTSSTYSEGSIYIMMCSGTGDCSNYSVIASNRNYNTYSIATSNPQSFGHTYKACFSARFGTTSYSNYCTLLQA